MKLLIRKGHKFSNALLSEATLPCIPQIRIPEYLAGLMKLWEDENLARDTEDPSCLCSPQEPAMMTGLSRDVVNFACPPFHSWIYLNILELCEYKSLEVWKEQAGMLFNRR